MLFPLNWDGGYLQLRFIVFNISRKILIPIAKNTTRAKPMALVSCFKKALNCTPPLLVEEPDDDDDFCSQRFNVTEQEGNRIRDLFENHFNLFKPSSCKKPCTRTTYEVQSMEVLKYPAPYIGLSFDSTVELTETKFRNNFVTLLTGLGGSVKQLNDQFKHLSVKFIR